MADPLIKPEPGRVIWFYPGDNEAKEGWNLPDEGLPLAATIAGIVNMDVVHLSVFDFHGVQHSRTRVPLVAESQPASVTGYACWMPYQIAQAKSQLKSAEASVSRAERIEQGVESALRHQCIDMALRNVLAGSSPAEVLTMAQEIEQYILGRSNNPPFKDPA